MTIDDMKKTWALRIVVWAVVMAALGVGMSAIDVIADMIRYGSDAKQHDSHFVESVLFFAWLGLRVWEWCSRRVWIGSRPTAHPM